MGGPGSGTWYRFGRPDRLSGTVDSAAFVLDVRTLARRGVLRRSGDVTWSATTTVGTFVIPWRLPLSVDVALDAVTIRHDVTTTDPGRTPVRERVAVTVGVDWTPCHYGGRRPWFACPECGRRCALLYGTTRRGRFGWTCRTCSALRHASMREGEVERAQRAVRRIRRDVFGQPADHPAVRAPALNWGDVPARPRGMWYRTYWRRLAELDAAELRMLRAWRDDMERTAATLDTLYRRTERRRTPRTSGPP